MDFDICESDNDRVGLRFKEDVVAKRDGSTPEVQHVSWTTRSRGNGWTTASLKKPYTVESSDLATRRRNPPHTATYRLVWVDQPTYYANTVPVDGMAASGFTETVDQTVEIIDTRTGEEAEGASRMSCKLTFGVDSKGNLSTS